MTLSLEDVGLECQRLGALCPKPSDYSGVTCGAVGVGNGQCLKIRETTTFPANVATKDECWRVLILRHPPWTCCFQHQAVWMGPQMSGLEHFAFDRASVFTNEKMLIEDAQHWTWSSFCFFLVCWDKLAEPFRNKRTSTQKYLNYGSVSTLATRCTWSSRLKDIASLPYCKRTAKGSKRISRSSKGSKDNSWQNDEWWLEDALCIDVMSFGILWARKAWHFMLEWTSSVIILYFFLCTITCIYTRQKLTRNPKIRDYCRCFSFSKRVFSGSILVFRGVVMFLTTIFCFSFQGLPPLRSLLVMANMSRRG